MGKPKRSHLIIPDTQVKPGLKLDYLEWIGKYIANLSSIDGSPEIVAEHGTVIDIGLLAVVTFETVILSVLEYSPH